MSSGSCVDAVWAKIGSYDARSGQKLNFQYQTLFKSVGYVRKGQPGTTGRTDSADTNQLRSY
jgi:hypothetical protein